MANQPPNASAKNGKLQRLEAKRGMPIAAIILESYWINRSWNDVAKDLRVCRTTLLSWRRQSGISTASARSYVNRRLAELNAMRST